MNILAIDVGFGNTKVVWGMQESIDHPTQWSELVFPSTCPEIINKEKFPQFSEFERVAVEVEGRHFWVGPDSNRSTQSFRTLSPEYIYSPQYEALIRGAWHYMIRESGAQPSNLDLLVLGLPVADFAQKREDLGRIGKRSRLIPMPSTVADSIRIPNRVLHVNKMLVLPQPFGAAILARTAAGNASILDSRVKTLVIDPGYFTFDWLMLDGGQPVLESSGSFEGGVSQLLNSVAAKIRADHGSNLTLDGVETGLRLGEANFGYKRIDMKPYRQQMRAAADQVVAEFLGYLTIQRAGVHRIFLAGGGAHEYLPSLQARLPEFDIRISESPIMDNARGFYAFGAHTLKSMANG